MTLTMANETAGTAQTINLPLLCPDGRSHELAPLFCPHSHPHSDPPTTPDGEDRIAGVLCVHCDLHAMYEPWCYCEENPR